MATPSAVRLTYTLSLVQNMQIHPSLREARRLTPKRLVQKAVARSFGVEVSLRRHHPKLRDGIDTLRAAIGEAAWERALELEFGVFDPEESILFVTHDAGLYGCLSVALWSLCDLLSHGHAPLRLDFSNSLSAYTDQSGTDPYALLFDGNPPQQRVQLLLERAPANFNRFDHHGSYSDLDCPTLRCLIDCYFQPSEDTRARIATTRATYLKPGKRYAGVWFRGTDKSTEVLPTDSSMYIDVVDRMLSEGQAERVLIQTDQQQVCDLFTRVFAGACDVIESLSRTSGQHGIHKAGLIEGERLNHARDMIAAATLVSGMDQIVTYTGNIGAWLAMMRGHTRGIWQARAGSIDAQWQADGSVG